MHKKGKGAQRSACKGQIRGGDDILMLHPRADRGTGGVSKVDRSHRITDAQVEVADFRDKASDRGSCFSDLYISPSPDWHLARQAISHLAYSLHLRISYISQLLSRDPTQRQRADERTSRARS
jgi:hypothetical protein